MFTHEQYIQSVAAIAIARLSAEDKAKAAGIKLAYGAGQSGLRGVTYYDKWGKPDAKAPFVEVCAFGQESLVQLAGTTIHELGHVLAGWSAGHGKEWKAACKRLGLRRIKAAGTNYTMAMFEPDIREKLAALPAPDDGSPITTFDGMLAIKGKRICTQGFGTRGGKSRGAGSGSRLRLFMCECEPPIRVRVARDEFDCNCNTCRMTFKRAS